MAMGIPERPNRSLTPALTGAVDERVGLGIARAAHGHLGLAQRGSVVREEMTGELDGLIGGCIDVGR